MVRYLWAWRVCDASLESFFDLGCSSHVIFLVWVYYWTTILVVSYASNEDIWQYNNSAASLKVNNPQYIPFLVIRCIAKLLCTLTVRRWYQAIAWGETQKEKTKPTKMFNRVVSRQRLAMRTGYKCLLLFRSLAGTLGQVITYFLFLAPP
jgi:hypothetical protein